MVSFVADTHAIIWHLTDPRRLARRAKRAFAAADAGRWLCYVPVVALLEIWLLHERGRLRIGPAQILEVLAAHPGYTILGLDIEQALEFGSLASVRDPLDRVILAAARVTNSRLVSADDELEDHGIERVWD